MVSNTKGYIFDCHTHAVDKEIYQECKSQEALKGFLGIRCDTYVMDDEEFYQMANQDPNYYVLEKINVYEGIDEHFKRIKALYAKYPDKIVGIKLYPGYDPIYPNDKRLYPVYDFALKHSLVIVFHNGDVANDEHMSSLKYSHPLAVDDLACAYPNLKIVISHLGFPFMMEAAMVVCKNDNVYTDFSGIIETNGLATEQLMLDLKRLLKYYPQLTDKLMFGTDFFGKSSAFHNLDYYLELTEKLFSDEEKAKIYLKTALKLYSIKLQ